jgi:hypothetical protein
VPKVKPHAATTAALAVWVEHVLALGEGRGSKIVPLRTA